MKRASKQRKKHQKKLQRKRRRAGSVSSPRRNIVEERGLDFSKRGALERWNELLHWVWNKCANRFPNIVPGISVLDLDWGPRNRREKLETDLLESVLMSETPEAIEDALSGYSLVEAFHLDTLDAIQEARHIADVMYRKKYKRARGIRSAIPKLNEFLYAHTYNVIRRSAKLEEHERAAWKRAKQLRAASSKGGRAKRKYSDAVILVRMRAFHARNPNMSFTSAVTTIIVPSVESPNDCLEYEYPESLMRRLKQICAPKRPSDWWESLKKKC